LHFFIFKVIEKIENLTKKSPIAAPITEKNMWQNFPLGISSVNKERVYIVTPLPQLTPRSYSENRKQKILKEAENNTKEVSDIKKMETNKSDTFESIEKAYQVLPQAVNNLAVASTGPESAHLWGIMEHDDFASSVESVDSEYDSNNTKLPIYSRLSKARNIILLLIILLLISLSFSLSLSQHILLYLYLLI